MSQHGGYYSLVQFCPDSSRLEGVNIGVLLYCSREQRLQVLFSRNNQRIRKFFGNQNWDFVNRAKKSIEDQLKTQRFQDVSELNAYISKRANAVQLTPLRPMRILDIRADAELLYRRLVGRDPIERKRRIDGYLTDRLILAGVDGLVTKSVSVEIPDFNRSIRVPYAYQNGRFNLISPVQFDPDPEAIFAKTGKCALEGKLLYKNRHPGFGEMRLVVVANFADQVENSDREFVRKTFEEHSVSLHTFEKLDLLVNDIKHSAEMHHLTSSR
jgi:hypothetical protein